MPNYVPITWSERLAVKITGLVGTMTCAAIFSVLAIISLPSVIKSHDMIVVIGWITQTFLQLVLLPIIMVGQQLNQKRIEHHGKLHKKTHDILDERLPK